MKSSSWCSSRLAVLGAGTLEIRFQKFKTDGADARKIFSPRRSHSFRSLRPSNRATVQRLASPNLHLDFNHVLHGDSFSRAHGVAKPPSSQQQPPLPPTPLPPTRLGSSTDNSLVLGRLALGLCAEAQGCIG